MYAAYAIACHAYVEIVIRRRYFVRIIISSSIITVPVSRTPIWNVRPNQETEESGSVGTRVCSTRAVGRVLFSHVRDRLAVIKFLIFFSRFTRFEVRERLKTQK